MTDSPIELLIKNQKGLHARAAAAFVKCVSEYDADRGGADWSAGVGIP